jgi:hypothetical protein
MVMERIDVQFPGIVEVSDEYLGRIADAAAGQFVVEPAPVKVYLAQVWSKMTPS